MSEDWLTACQEGKKAVTAMRVQLSHLRCFPYRSAQLLKISILPRYSLRSTTVCVYTPDDIPRQKVISVVFAGFSHPALTSRTQPQSWVRLKLLSLYSHRLCLLELSLTLLTAPKKKTEKMSLGTFLQDDGTAERNPLSWALHN